MIPVDTVHKDVWSTILAVYPGAKPVDIVFYDPTTRRHLAVYMGAEGRYRVRVVQTGDYT